MLPRIYRRAALPAACAVILLLTLTPIPGQSAQSASSPWNCLVCGEQGLVDVIFNVLLFVPLGFAARRLGWRLMAIAVAGFCLSLFIELAQFTLVAGRDASLSDLITNTVGSVAGALLATRAALLIAPSPVASRRLGAATGAVWLAMTYLTSVLFLPAPLPDLMVLWTPAPASATEGPRGTLDTVRFNNGTASGTSLGARSASFVIAPRHSLLEGTQSRRGVTDGIETVVDIADTTEVIYVRAGQLGQKGVFSARLNSSRLRLRTPDARVYQALPLSQEVTATIGGELDHGALRAWVKLAADTLRAERRLTPGLGWTLILPVHYPFDHHETAMAILWLAPLLTLGAYYAGRGRLSWPRSLAAIIVLISAGLIAVPALLGQPGDTWPVMLCVAGIAILGRGVGSKMAEDGSHAATDPA